MIPKHTHSQVWEFHTGAETKGSLGSIPMVFICFLSPSASVSHIVPRVLLSPPLLSSSPPPPPPLPPPPPSRPLGPYAPDTTTAVQPLLPSAAPPPDTAPILGKFQCIGLWYYDNGGRMSSPPLVPMPQLLPPKVDTPI